MKHLHPFSAKGLTLRGSALAAAVYCGFSAHPLQAAVLVDLDATQLPEGQIKTWTNKGSVTGDFTSSGLVTPSVVVSGGVKGVKFTGGSTHYKGPNAPEAITGPGTRTIEAWVFNPSGSDFETIIAWGHRGGPDNSNSAFSHGVHGTWGAFGGWGAGDLDWQKKITFGKWNYIVYTYDGANSTVYSDGVQANQEAVALDTWAFDNLDPANPLPIRLGAQNLANGSVETGEAATMTIAKIRVHDAALTAEQIMARFDSEKRNFGFNDDDNDGLPNSYEEENSSILNPKDPSDASKDPDGDGLTNLEEFKAKTLPNNPDTDGDGAKDGAELKRTGGATNPLVADTDGDGAPDGAETGTGTYVGINDLGTDPLVADSDLDGFSDGQERAHGSNPLSASSTPSISQPIISLDATSLQDGALAEWINQGALPGNFIATGTPKVTTVDGVKGVTFTGTEFYTGPETPDFITGSKNHSIEAWIFNPAAADEETIFSWGRRGGPDASNVSFNHGVNGTWGAVGHWGAPDIGWGDGGPVTGRWTHVVYTWDETAVTTTVYQNGVMANNETLAAPLAVHRVDTLNRPLHFRVASQNEATGEATGGLRGSMTIARLRVHDRVLTADEIGAKYTAEAGEFGLIDFDKDGLPTGFERRYSSFLNPNDASDAAKDQDKDGLTNLEEYQLGTLIDDPDTDKDGVADGAETRRNPPTQPKLPDTDGDGLRDGLETSTDPLVADSDGDGFLDGQEVFHGSNPALASSTPNLSEPAKLVDLNASSLAAGPLQTWPNGGKIDYPFSAGSTPGTVENVAGVKAVTLDGTQYYVGPAAPGFIADNAPRTIDAWIFNPEAADEETIFSWGSRGGPDGSNTSFNHGANPTYGAVGHWGAADVGWSGKVVVGQWTHVAYTYDPATTTATVYSDGAVATSQTLTAPLATHATDNKANPEPLRFLLGAQNEADGTATMGMRGSMSIGRIRVYDGLLSADAISRLYAGELSQYTVSNLALETPRLDLGADKITLKWSAVPSAAYTLEGSSDLKTWTSVATGIQSDSYVIEKASSKSAQYFRVRSE